MDVRTDNMPVWGSEAVSSAPSFARLTTTIDADVCVIGLGGSGLACIAELIAAGTSPERVVGVDAGAVGSGAAGRNGGFLLAGTADFYHDAVRQFGRERARRLYELTVEQIEAMASEMPENVRRTGSLRIAPSDEEQGDCAEHLAALRADGFPGESYAGPEGVGLLVPTDCAFDPLRRCRSIARRVAEAGARLFEHSSVTQIRSGEVAAGACRVRCDRVIVAVDGRLADILPELAPRVRPVRLQMIGTAPTREITVPRPVYARWGYDYWQQLDDGRLLLGGFRDVGGEDEWTDDATPSARVQGELEHFLRNRLCVRAAITHRWAATVSYSNSGLPVFDEVRPGVIATGAYSGTGNVLGALCGRAAARLALGERDGLCDLLAV
ncbi:MAG TPA: FAD-dependent oxidoreductase [Gemmatimonadaceae bacterium]